MTGAQAGLARVAGRWLVQECTPWSDGQNLTLTIGGPGWMWIDQPQVKWGGKYHVRQYVSFTARATIRGSLDVAYDANARVASVWLTPTAAPIVAFAPVSHVNAQAQNLLARVVKALPITALYADAKTQAVAEELGTQKFTDALLKGATITFNTASGQLDLMLGRLANGTVPQRPIPAARWLANERQELHRGGLQIAGPFPYGQPAQLDFFVERGNDFQFAAVCAETARSAVAQLVFAQPQSNAPIPPATFVTPGQRYLVPLNPPPCDWTLVTYSHGDTTVAMAVLQ